MHLPPVVGCSSPTDGNCRSIEIGHDRLMLMSLVVNEVKQ
jgi:hypothetical protein